MHGLVQTVRNLEMVQLATCQLPQLDQFALDRRQHPGRQHPREIRAQDAVVGVLVTEFGSGLVKGHGVQAKSKSQRKGAEYAKVAKEKQDWRNVKMLCRDPIDNG